MAEKDKNLIDKLEADIQKLKLSTDEEASEEKKEKIDKAEEKMENVVERKVENHSDTIKGLLEMIKQNPALVDTFRDDPAKFVRDNFSSSLSAAEVEKIVGELKEGIGGAGLLGKKIVPPISPIGSSDNRY